MVLGSHVIFGTRAFWLPNDPRGSWSQFVGSWELFRFGPATKTTERRSLAYKPHDRARRLAAKQALKYPPVVFNGLQARAVGEAFANYVKQSGLEVWACAILPDHVHMVLARHRLDVEQLVIQLKGAATERLIEVGLHPYGQLKDRQGRTPKCFSRGEWKVFNDSLADVPRAIRYVERNPEKEGLPAQRWTFVVPFDGPALALRSAKPPRRG
jgi:REP element-mobilizing transposase RayT